MPALMVIDEAAVPSIYWEPRDPRLNRQGLLGDLKQDAEITGVTLDGDPLFVAAEAAVRSPVSKVTVNISPAFSHHCRDLKPIFNSCCARLAVVHRARKPRSDDTLLVSAP